MTDPSRFFTVLAFLSPLPDVDQQHAALHRRLAVLEQPACFFDEDDRPLRAAEVTDPYRWRCW